MNNAEFHEINTTFYSVLENIGFKKSKSSSAWKREGSNNVSTEFAVRPDQYGWFPQYGSSFMYELRPIFKGKPVHYYLAPQLRLYELSAYDEKLVEKAEEILNRFSAKLPAIEDSEGDDHYVLLKSGWSQQKISKHLGHWYYYYDNEDILRWHKATYTALINAIDEMQIKFESEDFENRKDELSKDHLNIDPHTGEVSDSK